MLFCKHVRLSCVTMLTHLNSQKVGGVSEKLSCHGKLFIANFTFRAMTVFSMHVYYTVSAKYG